MFSVKNSEVNLICKGIYSIEYQSDCLVFWTGSSHHSPASECGSALGPNWEGATFTCWGGGGGIQIQILRHSEIWRAADEAVLNKVHTIQFRRQTLWYSIIVIPLWSDLPGNSSQIHSPWLGDLVDSGIGLSFQAAMQPICSLTGPVRQPYARVDFIRPVRD